MSKHKSLAVTEAAKQAGRQIAVAGVVGRRLGALMAEGERIAASLPNGHQRSLQLVSAGEDFSALIKVGKKTFEFKGDDFAITTHGD